MNKLIFRILPVIILLFGVFIVLSGCEKKKQKIDITELSLGNMGEVCDSMNHLDGEKLYMANTKEEYETLLHRIPNSLPNIDFSTSTFIFIRGGVQCLLNQKVSLLQEKSNKYTLTVDLLEGIGLSVESWYIAICTNKKIPNNATINLKINKHF